MLSLISQAQFLAVFTFSRTQ